jgi:hypothetical protein
MTNFKTGMHRRVHEILSEAARKYSDGLHDGELNVHLESEEPDQTPERKTLRPVAWTVVLRLEEAPMFPSREPHEGPRGRIEVLAVKGTGRLLVRFHPGTQAIAALGRPWAEGISKKFEGLVDPSLVNGDRKEALKRYVAVAIDSLDWSGVGEEPPLSAWDAMASKARRMFQAEVLRSRGASEGELEALGLGKSSLDDFLK